MSPEPRTPRPDWFLLLVWTCLLIMCIGFWIALVFAISQAVH